MVKDAESPKGRIVIRAEDFSSWLVPGLKWNWGLMASFHEKPPVKTVLSNGISSSSLLNNTKLDLSEVEKEKGMIYGWYGVFIASILSNCNPRLKFKLTANHALMVITLIPKKSNKLLSLRHNKDKAFQEIFYFKFPVMTLKLC